ncbi:MAG TPA: hypothetical protein VMV18_05270, partial [bacterium]|nr:hypothetical protein [bacterium]
MRRSAPLLLAAALVAAAGASVGCTHSTLTLARGGTTPTPTPTPPGDGVSVLYYRTVSGAADVTVGECVGIGFHDSSGRFSSSTTITFRDTG